MTRGRLAAAIAGVSLLAVGLVLATTGVGPEWLSRAAVIGGVALLASSLLLAVVPRRSIRATGASPTVVGSALVVAILVVVNLLVARHPLRWDTTATRRFTLSDQSRQVLRSLPDPVEAIAFTQGEDRRVEDLLKQYAAASRRFSFRTVDPDRRPEVAQAYKIRDYGTVVLAMGGRTERVAAASEQAITSALIRLREDRRVTVHVLAGHGGRRPSDEGKGGLSSLAEALRTENYEVTERVLLREGLPPSSDVLLLAGPTSPPLAAEVDSLERFLSSGGRLLLLLEPSGPSLEELTKPRGIRARMDVLVDASGVGNLFGMSEVVPLVAHYADHPITKGFSTATFFPLCRSLQVEEGSDDSLEVTCLAHTGSASWGETGSLTEGPVSFGPEDHAGPLCVGAAASWRSDTTHAPPAPRGRLVVFGDADFVSNAFLNLSGNRDLALNAVSWLAERDELIAIRPRGEKAAYLTMSTEAARSIFVLVVVVMPLSVLIAGLARRWRR